jgi:hypothetical protein
MNPLALAAIALLATAAAHQPEDTAQVDTIYDTPQGMVTLVTGNEGPDVNRGSPLLAFQDDAGRSVQVYADRPITLAQARAALLRCRDARARVAAMRRRLAQEQP